MAEQNFEQKIEQEIKKEYKHRVHWILAHSYSFFLLMFLVGLFFGMVFPIKFLENSYIEPIGFIFILMATALIFWSQTSRHFKKDEITKKTFSKGPYCITRNPTYWGLFFLMFGFGLVVNAFFVVLVAFVSIIFAKFTFIKKEEDILKKKYGDPYMEYKKCVKL